MLISKEALDNHIVSCYESRIDKMRDEHLEEIKKIKNDYESKIEELTEYMLNHVNLIEENHIKLNSYLIEQIKKLSSL